MNRKVLITGGGFFRSHLAKMLSRKDHVFCLVKKFPVKKDKKSKYLNAMLQTKKIEKNTKENKA